MILGPARVGRYAIERHVASGGMAEVYMARDSSNGGCVALKIPHDGEEIWEAERTGAVLQIELSNRDPRVPRVFEIGDGDEKFVAMEYVEGVDLSRRLQAGPLDWHEAAAIAIELCGVLATARSCGSANGEPGGIVHGDIKPRNIRIQHDGHIKVLDFGIAKALRQTRAETRNLYGSVPYSSPERLDRGHVDYHSDLWSVAVVLYEMLEGRPPFSASGDADVERSIRAGTPAAPLGPGLPAGFSAVLARALAPALADRYASAQELEADLRAVLGGRPIRLVRRAPAAGVPDPDATRRTAPGGENGNGAGSDPDATRRTGGAATTPDVEATRRSDADATRRTPRGYAQATEATAGDASLAPAPVRPAPIVRAPGWLRRVPWRVLMLFVLLFVVAREIQAFGSAVDLRSALASRPRGEAAAVWSDYRRIVRGRLLVHLTGVDGAVRDWMVSHADDLISRYRSDTPTIYESGWRGAEALLERAATIDPGNHQIQARLEYCRGHLLRVAARSAKQPADAMSRYDEAMSRFERATRLWSHWGDPWIGMAQIDAYVKRDPERTAEALGHAREAGYPFGERETALLGDAYRLHAEHLWSAPVDAFDADQRYRHLERIRDDCAHAIEQYELVPSYPGVDKQLRGVRERMAAIDERLNGLSSGDSDGRTFSPMPGTRL